jgi:hypothetical protein
MKKLNPQTNPLLHPIHAHGFEHPFWLAFFGISFFLVNVPTNVFHYRNFEGFHKFNPGAVWIFDVRKTSSGFTHVRGVSAINSKSKAVGFAFFFSRKILFKG